GGWGEGWVGRGAEAVGGGGLQLAGEWLHQRAGHPDRQATMLPRALVSVVCGDILRPSLAWLVAARYDIGLAPAMARRDPQGFAQLDRLCSPGAVTKTARHHTPRRALLTLA